MKNLILFLLTGSLYAACTGTASNSNSGSSSDTSSAALPYTAAYSSKFAIGSANAVATVLNNYKAWENGDMDELKNTMADSVMLFNSDGSKFTGTRDSATKTETVFRDSLSKVQIKMDAWISLHVVDKNEDWVSVWYTEIDTFKTGKVDSTYNHDDNRVDKNGKIVYTNFNEKSLK